MTTNTLIALATLFQKLLLLPNAPHTGDVIHSDVMSFSHFRRQICVISCVISYWNLFWLFWEGFFFQLITELVVLSYFMSKIQPWYYFLISLHNSVVGHMTKQCRIAVDVFENQFRGSILSCGRKTITPGHPTHGKYGAVNTLLFRMPSE